MPGAELEELVDESTWKGKISVKLGAIALTYATTVVVDERDDAKHVVVLRAKAREVRGRGGAIADICSEVTAGSNGGAHVNLSTDLTVTGAVAQNARGMIGDISQRLTAEFASCLSARIASAQTGAAEPEPTVAAPIGGMRIGIWAVGRVIGRVFSRLWNSLRSLFGGGQ
jgi:carbon monoxide dehydrogenase subunit G